MIEAHSDTQNIVEVDLIFNSGNKYYATDILDEFLRFLEENFFTDIIDYLHDEFNIDGLYDVLSDDNDNWMATINWLKRDAVVFQGYDIDLELDYDSSGNLIYRIFGEVK